jgi:membrane associated rhomboid family serine protease
MLPLRDNIPSRTRPVVNYAIIAVTGLVFLAQLSSGSSSLLSERLGMIPARVEHPDAKIMVPDVLVRNTVFGPQRVRVERPAAPAAVPPWLTLVTCLFLHGGWLHFLGNMWFLWIFGDNVEDRLGHWGYLLFYLGAGTAASLSHLLSAPGSPIPTIGASGAIAGVMGAYMLLYPRALVLTVLPIFFFLQLVVLPAPIFLGIWFVIQLIQGVSSVTGPVTTGVAWWAHIGGFAVGAAVVWLLDHVGALRSAVGGRRAGMERMQMYRRRF